MSAENDKPQKSPLHGKTVLIGACGPMLSTIELAVARNAKIGDVASLILEKEKPALEDTFKYSARPEMIEPMALSDGLPKQKKNRKKNNRKGHKRKKAKNGKRK